MLVLKFPPVALERRLYTRLEITGPKCVLFVRRVRVEHRDVIMGLKDGGRADYWYRMQSGREGLPPSGELRKTDAVHSKDRFPPDPPLHFHGKQNRADQLLLSCT